MLVIDVIQDALFLYYDIPRYYARKLKMPAVLRNENGKVVNAKHVGEVDCLRYSYQ